MSQSRFHRRINDLIHVINGANGVLLSFDISDGLVVVNYPEKIENVRSDFKKDFSVLHTAVDQYAIRADTYFQEMLVLSRQFDRHEKWIKKIADKIGVKLEI